MVPRKANIIFGCIKRSIMYKIEEGLLFLFPWCTQECRVWVWARTEEPPSRPWRQPVQETAEAALEEEAARMGPQDEWIWTST